MRAPAGAGRISRPPQRSSPAAIRSGRQLSPNELSTGGLFNWMISDSARTAPRRHVHAGAGAASLTEPPPGYQTPSPTQPYGPRRDDDARWRRHLASSARTSLSLTRNGPRIVSPAGARLTHADDLCEARAVRHPMPKTFRCTSISHCHRLCASRSSLWSRRVLGVRQAARSGHRRHALHRSRTAWRSSSSPITARRSSPTWSGTGSAPPTSRRQIRHRALPRAPDVQGHREESGRQVLADRRRDRRPGERVHLQRLHRLLPARRARTSREGDGVRGRPHDRPRAHRRRSCSPSARWCWRSATCASTTARTRGSASR